MAGSMCWNLERPPTGAAALSKAMEGCAHFPVAGPLSLPLVVVPLAKPYQEPERTEPVNVVHPWDLPGHRGRGW